jgi:hypothetical protein
MSYVGVGSAGTAQVAYGNSTSLSQSVTVSGSQCIFQAFGITYSASALGSLTGGTNRYVNGYSASGFHAGLTISDAIETTVFGSTSATSNPWASIAVVLGQ